MADTKPETKPETEQREVNLNGTSFKLDVKLDNRSRDKEDRGAFLALNPKTANVATLNQFIVAAGQVPLVGAVVRAINKIIGPASKAGFSEVTNADGTTTWTYDASKASAAIISAVADSVSSGKDELEAKLADARAAFEEYFDKNILPSMGAGKCPPPEVVNRMYVLKQAVHGIEAKLKVKTRTKKADKAEAAAAAK